VSRTEDVRATLVVPAGWRAEPLEASATLDAHEEAHFTFRIKTPVTNSIRRARIAADVTIGKRHFGQHAEALITLK